MTIRVGIIGTGLIGEDHGRKLVNVINGSTVSARHGREPRPRARRSPNELGGAAVFDNGADLISVRPGRCRARHVHRARPTPSTCWRASRPASR